MLLIFYNCFRVIKISRYSGIKNTTKPNMKTHDISYSKLKLHLGLFAINISELNAQY